MKNTHNILLLSGAVFFLGVASMSGASAEDVVPTDSAGLATSATLTTGTAPAPVAAPVAPAEPAPVAAPAPAAPPPPPAKWSPPDLENGRKLKSGSICQRGNDAYCDQCPGSTPGTDNAIEKGTDTATGLMLWVCRWYPPDLQNGSGLRQGSICQLGNDAYCERCPGSVPGTNAANEKEIESRTGLRQFYCDSRDFWGKRGL